MNKILKKISWLTRKWNLKFTLLNVSLHDGDGAWGFSILEITNNYYSRALLAFYFRLPNGADIRTFVIDDWDIFFIERSLWKAYDDLSDRKIWSRNLSKWETLKLNILEKLYK